MESVLPPAPLSLKFIVVGGSISGLACGYLLRRAGHDVTILEKSDGKSKVCTII
jgi:salicylate hydroxylase